MEPKNRARLRRLQKNFGELQKTHKSWSKEQLQQKRPPGGAAFLLRGWIVSPASVRSALLSEVVSANIQKTIMWADGSAAVESTEQRSFGMAEMGSAGAEL